MAKATATIGKVFNQAQSTLRLVDPSLLLLNPENERDYADPNEGIDSLYQSILSEGLKTPIQVYADGTVHDGNRRLTVINRLREEGHAIHGPATRDGEVLSLVVERPSSSIEAVIARLNTNEAKQFSSLAQARAFSELRSAGMSNADIAKRSPFTAMHIGNMLTLADAGEAIHHVVRENQISATLAVETLRKYGEIVVLKAVDLALRSGKERATGRHVDEVVNMMAKVEADNAAREAAKNAPAATEAPFNVEIPEDSDSGEVPEGVAPEGVTPEGVTPEGVTPEGESAEVPEGTEEGSKDKKKGKGKDKETKEETKKPTKNEGEASEGSTSDGEASATTYKFTVDAGKALLLNFLPYAKRRLAGDISDVDFNTELDLFVKELADYGIKVD